MIETTGCVICGKYLSEGDGMVCKACQADADDTTSSAAQKNSHIHNTGHPNERFKRVDLE